MLRFTLNIFQLNLTMNMFHIHTPLQSNQSMIMKWTISWNSSIQNIMMIFWMLSFRWFRLDKWSTLLQNVIQSLRYCFIKIYDRLLQLKIECYTFLCLYQPRPLWNWIMETRYIPKELGLCYVALLTVWLYIQLDQFIIVQVTLPTLYNKVPSNFILVSKRLHLNLFNNVTLLTLKVVLGDRNTRPTKILTIFNSKFQDQSSQRQEYFCLNCMWTLKTNSLSTY